MTFLVSGHIELTLAVSGPTPTPRPGHKDLIWIRSADTRNADISWHGKRSGRAFEKGPETGALFPLMRLV